MEKKLDSAQRRFNPKFGSHNNAEVKQFSAELEKQAALTVKKSQTQVRRAATREANKNRTPST